MQEDFEKRAQSVTAKSKLKSEIRFKAEAVSPGEWERYPLARYSVKAIQTEWQLPTG